MKTIIYFFIISFFAIALTSSAQKISGNNKSVILRASNKNVTTPLLQQSVEIISARLKTYGLTSFDLGVIAEKGQIKIQLPDNLQLSEIEGLLISRGELAFYETLTLDGINDYLKNDPRFSPQNARIGCASSENHDMSAKIEEYLKSRSLTSVCKLLWGIKNDKSLTCLYALKISNAGKPLLIRSDVESIKSSEDNKSQSFMIDIKFNPASVIIWKNATKENLNKPIAIVIDDKVFYDPVLKATIENGLCEISGNMTSKEVNYFLALVNNELLPLNLSIVK